MKKKLAPVGRNIRASAMGKNSEKFSLFFNYGGTFIKIEDSTEYYGGNFKSVYGLDTDRFGYFDLVEEVEKLGVKEFDKIMYQDPGKLGYAGMKEIVDDSGVMEMINTGHKLRSVIQVYVAASNPNKEDGDGVKVVHNASEGSNSANRLADGDGDVNVGDNATGDEHLDSDANIDYDDDANDGDKAVGGGVLPDVAMWSDEDSANEDYFPVGVSSSDDDLTDEEHASDDDEYLEVRQNLRKCKNKMVEEDGGANNTFSDCLPQMNLDGCEVLQHALMSEESGSEMEMNDEGNCIKRKLRVIYDPRCDHNALQFELGMSFESIDQCKRAVRKVAIV
ncbi:disease resistance protein [Striga asiatica]|uniref:Disease resistance protein n=1 Tax=Striga asiatica TaxID=4170 RepID=A0A5A7QE43_STRAF|nr:disease resistance protein [Striga asiatica]